MLTNIKKKKRKKEITKENQRKKKEHYWRKNVSQKSQLIWFETMTKSFGLRVANHSTTDIHTWFASLGIYISSRHF